MSDRIQGLRGLKGLSSLSPEEQDSFMSAHADTLSVYKSPRRRREAANVLYMNQKFIDTFGIDKFNEMNDGTEESFNLRNEGLFDYKVKDAYQNRFGRFGTNPYNDQIALQLDAQGMYDLLQNEEYMGPYKRKKMYEANLKAAQKVGKSFDKAANNPYVDAIGAGFMQWGKTSSALTPPQNDANYAERDDEILKKLFAETQKRREANIQGDTNSIYASMLSADDAGKKSLAQSYKEFDNFATKNSPHYKTFKNTKWLSDYTNEDRLKDYAKYLALKQKYGEVVALNYFERSMQDRVADAQDGKWTGNTLKGVLTTTWSDLGSNVALFANVGKSAEEMSILNQGKDPNKPIYDKRGNVVDYQRNDNWVTNPAYWNNVYKYNTFSPTEIKAIEERGGISEDVNVRQFGYTPDFFSWDTMEEGFKQSGHIGAGIIETALTGAAGKAIGWAGKGAMKLAGLSAKAMQTASKAGKIANNFIVGATTGLEGSQLEAMGTFDDQMQTAKEKIQDQIKKELYDYQRSINYNSNAAKLGIGNIYRQLKANDIQRVARGNREGSMSFPLSDETLRTQAKQLYTKQLLSAKQQELQELHKKDELAAAKAAEKAYATNFWMDYIKNVPLTVGIQKYKIAKGSMKSAFDNTLKESIVSDAETGGVKRNAVRHSSGKQLSKAIAKQFIGGFADEYLDGLNASFATGIGNNEFSNYIKKTYDPKAYSSTVDTMLGNMLAGMSEEIDGITDRQNLYEGFIGAISPIASTTINHNAIFRPKDTWRAIVKGIDENGKKLSKGERLSRVLMNPLLDTYAEAKEKDRNIDSSVDAINAVVAANKDKLQDASKIISVLNNYNGELNMGNSPYAILDSKDGKLHNAFTLLNVLNTLENMDGGTYTNLYKESMDTIEGLAKGTLSKEQMDTEVDQFLTDDNNKSILDEADMGDEGAAKAREFAAKKLQKNAQYFMEMKDRLADVKNTFAHSSSMKNVPLGVQELLAYNIIAGKDYKKRLQGLEEEFGVGSTDTETLYKPNYSMRYYTPQSRNRAVLGRERQISKLQKEIDEHQHLKENIKQKEDTLKEELKATSEATKRSTLEENIQEQENLFQSTELAIKTLEEQKRKLIQEKEEISKATSDAGFDESTILHADARDRAWILDPRNKDNYTEEVQAIIDNVSNALKQKDPEALNKLRDAGTLAQRVEDMRNVYTKILDNDKLAANYLEAVTDLRDRAAFAESLQRDINNYYAELGEAYINRGEEPENFKYAILNKSPELIEAYMEDHPNQADAFKPYYEMLKFDMDAGAIINGSSYTKEEKQAMIDTLLNMHHQANTREELEKNLEGIIDSPDVDDDNKKRFEYLMSKMQQQGYQRDATTIENRKKRKEREEKGKKEQEEKRKKAEEEAKKAAEENVAKDNSKEKEIPKNVDAEAVGELDDIDLGEDETPAPVRKETGTTTVDNGNHSFTVTFGEYEPLPETVKHEENADFEVHSSVIDGEDLYFIGNFAGDNEQTKVKATKDFIEKNNGEQQDNVLGADTATHPANLEVTDDNVQGRPETLEEQMTQVSSTNGKELHISDGGEDSATANGTGQYNIDNDVTTLSGNAMSRYDPHALEDEGIMKKKKGKREGDSMNNYYAWMDAAGINLQGIIDHELARIIGKNPHAKVKFMFVKPANNATHDAYMQKHYMLVLDYDNKINKGITAIHDDANGGVIESGGKKYLIIGVVGYGNMQADKFKLYKLLFNADEKNGLKLLTKRRQYFDAHPQERFYVTEDYSTEVVPYSQIPGYIVKQAVQDEGTEFRSVRELLADADRNPMHYTLDTVSWGIQQMNKFLIVGISPDKVMVPRDSFRNMGSAFVLMPASNGKMVPSYLKALKYTEMNDGALKERVTKLLGELTSYDSKARFNAIEQLNHIFYLSNEGDDIQLSKHTPEISFIHEGDIVKTFVLGSDFDRASFMKAVEDLNPRINITASVLSNMELLNEYDEAGALMTDAALFGTAGSSYSIYGLDGEGNMIVPHTPMNGAAKVKNNSDFRNEKSQVVYDHQYYAEDKGVFSLNGETITDETLIKQLQYNKTILDGGLAPVESKGVFDTYILDAGEHPTAIRVNRNTKKVKELSEDDAKKLVEKVAKEKAEKQREEAAQQVLEKEGDQVILKGIHDVDIDSGLTVDPETGEIISDEKKEATPHNEDGNNGKGSAEEDTQKEAFANRIEILPTKRQKGATQDVTAMLNSRFHKMRLIKIIRKKWKDAPKNISELKEFLRSKDIEVDSIGRGKTAVDAWIKTLEDCRK